MDVDVNHRQRVVIAGASLAGLRAAESLRRSGYTGDLVFVGAEHHLPYNRPPLSKILDAERTIPEALARHQSVDDATWRLGTQIVSADLSRRTVELGSGERIAWDGLVISTGLRPRALPLPGPEAGRHHLRSFFDGVTLGRSLGSARTLVIIGGGFIGCEVAAAAAHLGIRTHLVAPESTPLRAALGDAVGAEVQRRLNLMGVTFHLGAVPTRYRGSDRIEAVELSDGTVLPTDVAVEAVGSEPNVEWLAGNGLDTTDGVLTDPQLRAGGRPDVVACGDVARFAIPSYDQLARRLEHWTVAVDTARLAGANLAAHLLGDSDQFADYTAVPSFWSHMADLKVQSFGQPALGSDDVRLLEGDLHGDAAVGYHRDGELVGVVLLGLASRYAHYRRAVDRSRLALVSG